MLFLNDSDDDDDALFVITIAFATVSLLLFADAVWFLDRWVDAVEKHNSTYDVCILKEKKRERKEEEEWSILLTFERCRHKHRYFSVLIYARRKKKNLNNICSTYKYCLMP